ncbi:MAG: MFS transporter [Caulobacteraceae bacterium]
MSDAPRPARARDLLAQRDYVRFWRSRWVGNFGSTIQSVAMGWQVYALSRRTADVAHSAFNVSLIGLCTFAPLFLLALPAGATADRRNRRNIMLACYAVEAAAVGVLLLASLAGRASVALLLLDALVFGASRAYRSPATNALGPALVPRELLPRAIAWNSLAGQTASVAGPAAAGFLLAFSTAAAYGASFAFFVLAVLSLATVRAPPMPPAPTASRLEQVREGLSYVWTNQIVFGAISLDLAAVILGGATALLPAFARDVLRVGAEGFGILRAATSFGAAIVAVMLAAAPMRRQAGLRMFAGVAVYGAATIAFSLSKELWASAVFLAILGGADMLSVFVRQNLIQLTTPDPMRGRVAALSSLFVGASNELGEFESGLVARFLGVIGSALFGGAGALFVTGAGAALFPSLRKADRLE